MLRVMTLLGVFSLFALAASNPIHEVLSEAKRVEHQLVPAFYQGYLYWVGLSGPDNEVTIYAPDGHLAHMFVTQNGNVESVAIDADGGLAVAWVSPKEAGIDFRDNSGTLSRTVQTGMYVPTHIAFAQDHSLWSVGWQRDPADLERADKDYMIVREYLPDGKEAGAYLPRSLFPPGLEPAGAGWQQSSSITVAHDKVGLWAWSGDSSDKTEWLELDLNGNLLNRTRLDQFSLERRFSVRRLALTIDGHLFVQGFDQEAKLHRVYTLDQGASDWRELKEPPSGYLEGADGNALVFSDLHLGPIHLRWYEQPDLIH